MRKFGVVVFDDVQYDLSKSSAVRAADKDPESGWASIDGEWLPRRIAAPADLPADTIWWTNIPFDCFFFKTELHKCSWLRHDKYLVLTQRDILREWNYDPIRTDPATTCQVAARFFSRIMQISFSLVRAVDPSTTMMEVFVRSTLRGDLRAVIPDFEYPRAEAVAIMKADRAFSEFTATAMRPMKDATWAMVRKPRLSYAIEMLQTPVPVGPFEFMSRKDLKAAEGDLLAGNRPFVAEIALDRIDTEMAPVYGFGAVNPLSSGWVTQNECAVLTRLAELDVKSAWVGRGYANVMEMLPAPIREFLEDALCSSSWSAGVVAETLWRACFLKERFENAGNAAAETEEYNAMSWAGAWIKAADKISMFASAMDLVRSGYSVSSYGMGWVRVFLLQEMLEDFVCDALASGMVPSMIEIPVDQFNSGDKFLWGGDRNAKGLAYLQSTKQRDLLLNLDRLALQAA